MYSWKSKKVPWTKNAGEPRSRLANLTRYNFDFNPIFFQRFFACKMICSQLKIIRHPSLSLSLLSRNSSRLLRVSTTANWTPTFSRHSEQAEQMSEREMIFNGINSLNEHVFGTRLDRPFNCSDVFPFWFRLSNLITKKTRVFTWVVTVGVARFDLVSGVEARRRHRFSSSRRVGFESLWNVFVANLSSSKIPV